MGSHVEGYWRDDARSLRVPRAPERGIPASCNGQKRPGCPSPGQGEQHLLPFAFGTSARPALRGASVDEGSLWEPSYPHFTGQEAEPGRGPDAGGEGWGLLPSTT